MTQGTKIGLLVSLAFLIVIFVLLSDHVANVSDAKPAPMVAVGPTVNQSVVTPGQATPAPVEPAAREIAMAPQQPLPTVAEMSKPVVAPEIAIGPGESGVREISANQNLQTNRYVVGQNPSSASVRTLGDPSANPVIAENFIPADRIGSPNPTATTAAPQAPKAISHKALPGDTVSKMARKYYGSDSKANRDLIISANKVLKGDPTKVEVGRVYLIPAKASPAPIAAAATTQPIAPLVAATTPLATPAAATERYYTVKQGDNLWKIAKEQCKDINAVDQIKKINRDVLKNGIDLKIGTKLRLPEGKAAK